MDRNLGTNSIYNTDNVGRESIMINIKLDYKFCLN
jgi:hypothetical protein